MSYEIWSILHSDAMYIARFVIGFAALGVFIYMRKNK